MANQENGTTPKQDTYLLTRNTNESLRLTAQHYFLTQRQGWLIHPRIQEALKDIPNQQIADLATGTGIWALEVASLLPNAHVTGLDISSAQFPPDWSRPKNVTFGLLDLLEEVPESYRSRFDFVHVRLLLSAGPAVDKSVFITHFSQFLKPGGWLQWDELTYPNMQTVIHDPVTNKTMIEDMANHVIFKAVKVVDMKTKVQWFSPSESFAAALTRDKAEFCEAWSAYIPVKMWVSGIETNVAVAVMIQMTDMISKFFGRDNPEALKQLEEAKEQVKKESSEEGVGYAFNWWVGVARRSL
ncbi:hypothetical protein H2198_004499 [Neophaeococcomyces mojaviensis]|uniref:Uncharacterized protein n=1 Tax=Neophaeococcomyces mojaviensis TaxID=3383035 RepID=A0ACC3A8P5_9EURO|nr:hypothetical protein H2198_004499 [Knufia sp. JES_112]